MRSRPQAGGDKRWRLAKHFIESGSGRHQVGIDGRDYRVDRSHDLRGSDWVRMRMGRSGAGLRATASRPVWSRCRQLNAARVAGDADDLVRWPICNKFAAIVEPVRRWRPNGGCVRWGSGPGQSCLAADSLTMTERSGWPACDRKPRPSNMRNVEGLEVVWLDVGVVRIDCTFCAEDFCSSSEAAAVREKFSAGGRALVIAATPGQRGQSRTKFI